MPGPCPVAAFSRPTVHRWSRDPRESLHPHPTSPGPRCRPSQDPTRRRGLDPGWRSRPVSSEPRCHRSCLWCSLSAQGTIVGSRDPGLPDRTRTEPARRHGTASLHRVPGVREPYGVDVRSRGRARNSRAVGRPPRHACGRSSEGTRTGSRRRHRRRCQSRPRTRWSRQSCAPPTGTSPRSPRGRPTPPAVGRPTDRW